MEQDVISLFIHYFCFIFKKIFLAFDEQHFQDHHSGESAARG